MRRLFLTATLAATAACGGDDAATPAGDSEYGGTMIISTGADADLLMPPLIQSAQGNQVVDILFERLAEPGPELNSVGDEGFVPELAESWQWAADSLSIAFDILPGSRFHDGTPVTARDVAFTYDVYTDPATGSAEAELLSNIDSVTARDSMTAVFWFSRRYPQQFFDATYHMRIMSERAIGDVPRAELKSHAVARNPVGSARFRFVRWDPGAVLEVAADTAHPRGRPYLDRVIWTVTPDHEAAMTRLLALDADFIELVRANKLKEFQDAPALRLTKYPSLDIGYLHFNLVDPRTPGSPHPIFGQRQVRRALAMAIDREQVVRAVLDSLGAVPDGPFTQAVAPGREPIPQPRHDPAAARALLDSAGWTDRNGDGIRERNGRQLRFTIISPSTSLNRQRAAVLIQDMLKQVGVRVDLQVMDINPFISMMSARSWDAIMSATRYDPSPATVRQSWTSSAARSKDGSNYGSYRNPQFDRVVDSAVAEMDPKRARELYRRAYEMLLNDAPAVWLYETVNYAAHHQRIQPTGMRADAWWANLAEWKIPADARLPRDRTVERQAAR